MCTACEYLMLKSLETNIRREDIVAKTVLSLEDWLYLLNYNHWH